MPQSMTGYGQTKAKIGRRQFMAEFRSVNHRHLDFSVRMPASLSAYESELRQLVGTKIKRGKVNAYLSWNGDEDSEPEIDARRLKKYVFSLRRIAKELKLDSRLSISDIAGLPNIFSSTVDSDIIEKDWPMVRSAVEKALIHLVEMRNREGGKLTQDIIKRLAKIKKAVQAIGQKGRYRPQEFKEKLEKRIAELSGGVHLDDKTLAKEVALFADRSDITEELVRLNHHLEFFQKTLKEKEEVGKRLDFICQEIHRETNTIASKSGSFPIAKEVIGIKAEVEKIREQVQNIE